jgi:acyl phosphate:glycerol-3-phosphate acyltransferase
MIAIILIVLTAYLAGSIASAIIVCKLLGLPDPRQGGSGNPGATNVLRLGGKKAAAITLLGDVLKGLLPVLLAAWLVPQPEAIAAAAVAAFLGHLFPVFFGFKGGKGFATALGAAAGLSWLAVGAMAATWVLVAAVSRISSLSALIAALLLPVYLWWFTGFAAFWIGGVVITVMIFVRHQANVVRLLAGTEPRIGQKKAPAPG